MAKWLPKMLSHKFKSKIQQQWKNHPILSNIPGHAFYVQRTWKHRRKYYGYPERTGNEWRSLTFEDNTKLNAKKMAGIVELKKHILTMYLHIRILLIKQQFSARRGKIFLKTKIQQPCTTYICKNNPHTIRGGNYPKNPFSWHSPGTRCSLERTGTRRKQIPEVAHDIVHARAIVAEKAANWYAPVWTRICEGRESDALLLDECQKEAVQTGAMAFRWFWKTFICICSHDNRIRIPRSKEDCWRIWE